MASTRQQKQTSVGRPRFHFSTDGWINDPCAPGYDPRTGTYHLFYQCNPEGCEWGNMSWGHIVSKDLLTWTPAPKWPALVPDQAYDAEGVFTGCWMPPTSPLDKTLRVAYSSVKELPFHWSTPPYPRDAAGLSIATSHDGGETWEKSRNNPIVRGEPAGVHVTGFRDPFVTAWPPINDTAGTSATTMSYGLISGGIEGIGPTAFLYAIQQENHGAWTYLDTLVDLPARFQPSDKWSGNYGVNWECTNLVTLRAGSETRQFLIIGAEGDVESHARRQPRPPAGVPSRTVRAQLWMSGEVLAAGQGIKFQYGHGGHFDHGPYYAANSFLDPVSDRRIVYGWIPEEDIPLEAAKAKGWNGSLAIPREIFLLRIPQVQEALVSNLTDICAFETIEESDGCTSVFTLGVKPIVEMMELRKTTTSVVPLGRVMLPGTDGTGTPATLQTQSVSWELEAVVSIHPGCETVGFHVRHSNDLSIRTSITFSTSAETITVDREASTTDPTINTSPDSGPFTLLTQKGVRGGDDEPALEKLQLRIFFDGDILEIFANDRFALATMVYSGCCSIQDTGGITAFATGTSNSAIFETVTVWDGLGTNEKER